MTFELVELSVVTVFSEGLNRTIRVIVLRLSPVLQDPEGHRVSEDLPALSRPLL